MVVSIENSDKRKIWDGITGAEKLDSLLAESAAPQMPQILPRLITGRLEALGFQNRTLQLKLHTGRMLSGTYSADFEPILLEHPREWIQVRGEATLNEDGSLRALDNITDIIEVDDSPIVVTALRLDQRVRPVTRHLEFEVTFDPEDSIYTAMGDFHMMVSAETRTELEASVHDALAFLWREYVISRETFSDDAILLRNQLINAFGEADAA